MERHAAIDDVFEAANNSDDWSGIDTGLAIYQGFQTAQLGLFLGGAGTKLVGGAIGMGKRAWAYFANRAGGRRGLIEALDSGMNSVRSFFRFGGVGPGVWVPRSRGMKPHSRAFQRWAGGGEVGQEYLVGGVHFDGFRDGALIEAKGPGYDSFFTKNGNPRAIFTNSVPAEGCARSEGPVESSWALPGSMVRRRRRFRRRIEEGIPEERTGNRSPSRSRNTMGVIPNNVYIGAYWGARKETAQGCARRAIDFLKGLGAINPIFDAWFRPPGTEEYRVELTLPTMTELFSDGAHYTRDGAPLADIGFTIYLLWGPGEYAGYVSTTCGGYAVNMANTSVVTVPTDHPAAEEIMDASVMVRLLSEAVEHWSPDWATVCHDRLVDFLGIRLPGPQVGMATFLGSSRFLDIPDVPLPSKKIDLPARGSIILITEEPFSIENDAHLKAAEQVTKILRRHDIFRALPREWA
jgi:hypothetical protein